MRVALCKLSHTTAALATQALHARVLKLYGEYLRTQGRVTEADEMKRQMEALEVKYSFTTQ